ncbi:MAG: ABC transporter permease [Myxococcales bacterium]
MKTDRLVGQALRTMARYKLRSAFMMLGAFIGVAALVLVVSVGSGAEQKVLGTVQRLFSASSIFVSSGGPLLGGGPRGEASRMTLDDLAAIAEAVPAIDAWDPLLLLDPAPVRRGDASTTVRLLGQSERSERVWQRSATRGSSSTPTPSRARRGSP